MGSKRYGLSAIGRMATIMSSGGHIRTIRRAYSDRTKAIFLTRYVVDNEISLISKYFSYIF